MDSRRASVFNKEDSFSDDKRPKQDSSISLSDETGVKKREDIDTSISENVRFIPSVIEFVNAYEGKQFTEKLKIQNVGKRPIHVKVGEPNSFMFQLKKPNQRTKLLPSGCTLTKAISYTYHSEDLISKSQLPVHVNGVFFPLPIVVKTAKPEIEVNPQKLNFETINLGTPAKSMMLTILNTGGRRTKFEIDCGMHLDLVVTPTRGTLKPKHPVTVRVEVMQFKEGEFYRELWIKTPEKPIRVPVLVEVVSPRLEVPYPLGTGNLTLIHFKPTFRGAQRLQHYILKNVSVEKTMFATLVEIDGEVHVLKKAQELSEAFSMFVVTHEEGLLGPFENRICNILFRPRTKKIKKGWHHQQEEKSTQANQVVLLRINRIHNIEPKEIARAGGLRGNGVIKETEGKSASATENEVEESSSFDFNSTVSTFLSHGGCNDDGLSEEDKTLRLYIYGEAMDPDIVIQPSSLEFGNLSLGETKNKVIRITNKSVIPVKCKVLKKLNVKNTPEEVWLQSEKAAEILVSLTPSFAGNVKTNMKIQLLAESDVYYSTDKPLVVVGTYTVYISYTSSDICIKPSPIVGSGITPYKIDEVGLHKELVTFKDVHKLPYAAVLGLKKGFKPQWMKEEKDLLNNVDNAIVALPNDRPHYFQSWPKDQICRTIFKGIFRYSPPEDLAYTLTAEGIIEKKQRRLIWAEYLLKRIKEESNPYLKELECLEDLKVIPTFGRKSIMAAPVEGGKVERQHEKIPKFTFVPLSPIFLYRVDVQPHLINLSKVAVATTKKEIITINNTNTFPISVRFSSKDSKVWLSEEKTKVVMPQSTLQIEVFFRTDEIGQYFGFLNYGINGSHEFQIPISAMVLSKTLMLHQKNLDFSMGWSTNIFRRRSLFMCVENFIHCPVKYQMIFTDDSAFTAEVTRGEVPPRTRVLVEFLMEMAAGKCLFSEVTFISESGKTDNVKLNFKLERVPVNFLESRINLGDIPLNLPTVVQPVVHNQCYIDVFYEVVNTNPFPGVTVEPARGLLRARSFTTFQVVIKIPVVMSFSFEFQITANVCRKITCQITGNVVFPQISISPSQLKMREICEYSFDRIIVRITNKGDTDAEVALDFSSNPEFSVEGSSDIRLAAKEKKKMILRFNPKGICRYNFCLPLIINRILGPPHMHGPETEFASHFISQYESVYEMYGNVVSSTETRMKIPCSSIYCTVVKAPIRISPLKVLFRMTKISEFQPQIIQIVNVYDEDVTFCIRDDDLGEMHESPFSLSTVKAGAVEYRSRAIKAVLKPGEKLLLRANFQPKKPGKYEIETPVFIKWENDKLLYNRIHLKGKLEAPHILPKSSEVYFAPLPLDVACHVILNVWVENCKTSDTLNYRIWDPKSKMLGCDQLDIIWLDEPTISESCNNTFKLKIVFRSSIPIAIRKYIILSDSVGTFSTVLVTAVADNSAVTNHAFLSTQECKYDVVRAPTNLEYKKSELSAKDSKKGYSIDGSELKEENEVQPSKKGPKLVIQMDKSMAGITDLGMVNLINVPSKGNKLVVESQDTTNSLSKDFGSTAASHSSNKVTKNSNVITYPNFPTQENPLWGYYQATVKYVERWMFEMVMKCNQNFSIPRSFQRLSNKIKCDKEKDFLHFLKEVIGTKQELPKRPVLEPSMHQKDKVKLLHSFFNSILNFLQSKDCLLPHIRPEYLMEFDDYVIHMETSKCTEFFSWAYFDAPKSKFMRISEDVEVTKTERGDAQAMTSWSYTDRDFWRKTFYESVPDLDELSVTPEENQDVNDAGFDSGQSICVFRNAEVKLKILDKNTFEMRSTQAWLDIVIQVFKVFVLGKIVKKNDFLHQTVHSASETKVEKNVHLTSSLNHIKRSTFNTGCSTTSTVSNIYCEQERLLLDWLNSHVKSQCSKKILNNFNKDLSDSIALIGLTSSYCPYIVQDYFKDIFDNPDTPNKKHHNAARLVQAWRTLQLGFSVDTQDIMRPNLVFMIMLLTHLYDVLPNAYPSSVLWFSAPLNSDYSKVIQLKNPQGTIVYEAKFFGEQEGFFSLNCEPTIHVSAVSCFTIKFSVKQIRQISATLFLCGCVRSPNFGQHIVFNLEGEPSDLTEYEKHSIVTPLYKVICNSLKVRSPYKEAATYDILYTTRKPQYTGVPDSYFKPWSNLWKTKISRRLFLESSEIRIAENSEAYLRLTIACLTRSMRRFWLLFRSPIGSFIILLEISVRITIIPKTIKGFYPKTWPLSACTCPQKDPLKMNISCPCRTKLMIPRRNQDLWDSLRKMFYKTLEVQEQRFWEEYFEKNIGISLILWLLDCNVEEKEVIEEFVDVLSDKVTYKLEVESQCHVVFPESIEISDVRKDSEVAIPIHISNDAPPVLQLFVTMTSENDKEVRSLRVELRPMDSDNL